MRLGRRGTSLAILAVAFAGSCARTRPVTTAPSGQLFTCCNIRYEADHASATSYAVGTILPAGTPVRIAAVDADSVTFVAGDRRLTLVQENGANERSLQHRLDSWFVRDDPRPKIESYPPAVRRAIASGRVERGMTRDQVVVALGYPPSDRTPSLDERSWTYRYNRWNTYQVVFDDRGKVGDVVGRPAPTAEVPRREIERPAKTKQKSRKPVPADRTAVEPNRP